MSISAREQRAITGRGVAWCLAALVFGGCTTDEGAPRPAQSAHDRPPPAAVPAPSALPSSTPALRPTAAEPRDPLRASNTPIDCGPAVPNPHGFEHAWQRRDGSCKPCERPAPPAPLCTPAERAAVTQSKELSAHGGQRVRLRGTVVLGEAMCTKRGGTCGCNNRCSAPLQLERKGETATPIGLISQGETLGCSGDEASVCCPFELDRKTRSLEVIASGIWIDLQRTTPDDNYPQEPHLEVQTLCRVK